jgi:uncharacterized membrane protein YgdD (TMEM256/DUF423 family)
MNRQLALLSAILGFTGVGFGAFGAHSLKNAVDGLADGAQRLAWWDTGARYHLVHAVAVGVMAVFAAQLGTRLPIIAGWLFALGVLLFSGSLYVMGATGLRWLGAVTPLGGVSMLVGWTLMALAAWRLEAPLP